MSQHCTTVFLVGLGTYELPTDPNVGYFGSGQEAAGEPPFVGCNSLVCLTCRSLVKHADNRSLTQVYPPPRESLAEMHRSTDPASSTWLRLSMGTRTYFCGCTWYACNGVRSVDHIEAMWACGGHP